MVILFWNTQRFGAGMGAKRAQTFDSVVLELGKWADVELFLVCEVTSSFESKHVNKQIQRRRRTAKKDNSQLGYASFEMLDVAEDLNEVTLKKEEIPKFQDVFDVPRSGYKKGSNFGTVSKRYVAYAGDWEGVHVFVYHANSSSYGAMLTAWVAEHLRQENDGNFILVGDFNAEPDAVKACLKNFKADIADFSFAHDGFTYNAHSSTGPTKTLDYAIAGAAVKNPQVKKIDLMPMLKEISKEPGKDMSDHMPILVVY